MCVVVHIRGVWLGQVREDELWLVPLLHSPTGLSHQRVVER